MRQPNFEQAPQPVIREAVVSDAEPARTMQAQSWLDTYPNDKMGVPYEWVKARTDGWFKPESMAKSREILQRAIDDPKQFYRVAELNGQIVGFIHGVIRDDGSGHLWGLYTDKFTHGSGLSGRLMQELDGFFSEHGVTTVDLEVVSYNERAIRFYEKWGFTKVPGSEDLFADKMPDVRMERRL